MAGNSYTFLRKVPLFQEMPDEDLRRMCEVVEEVYLKAGQILFDEGSLGEHAYVIRSGQVEIFTVSTQPPVQLAVRTEGELIGEISLLQSAPRTASARALTDTELIAIGAHEFVQFLLSSPSATLSILKSTNQRLRNNQLLLHESEKMAHLGELTAGIAHELNNPTSAVKRGADQLISEVSHLQEIQNLLSRLNLSEDQLIRLAELDRLARERVEHPVVIGSLERTDLEGLVEEWLDDRRIPEGWKQVPVLVNLGLNTQALDEIWAQFNQDQATTLLEWLATTYSVYSLVKQIYLGAGRVSEIVRALKAYTYLDQAPTQQVDIHDGLQNTLVILHNKIKEGVHVHLQLAPDLPKIYAYGSELNQVWTNLIDNAIDAMNGKGELTIWTCAQDRWVEVDIEDNGPGISEEVQQRIFNPFFTTKPAGKGTGLGLNITYRIIKKHRGEILVDSVPGRTRFTVRLPVNFEEQNKETTTATPARPSDDHLLSILKSIKVIAVVGLSGDPTKPSHSVPAFLQAHGYRIIPVNPKLEEALGEQAFPDLETVPVKFDTVQIFRPSETVLPIVEAAIRKGARTIWMQEGIRNDDAARLAEKAGLTVVMDTCMRTTYKRLIGE